MSLLCESDPSPADSSAAPLTVDVVTGQELPESLLNEAATLETIGPFGRPAWWASWWKHLRPAGSELFLLTVRRGEELVGLVPWYRVRMFGWGNVVRYLGDGRACSDYASLAARSDSRSEVWNAVVDWTSAEAGKSWDAMILEGVSAADAPQQSAWEQLQARDVCVEQRTVANTWRVALPETWEEYVALFSKQHRNRIRRAQREFFDTGTITLRRVTDAADLERGFEIQRRLHQLRRHSLGDGGCFADARFETFVREVNAAFLSDRSLRLQWTEMEGQALAFDCGYVAGAGVFAYQTAFDPSRADLSPGRLHFQASMMKAIEEGYRHFDFLRGDEPYKAHFHAQPISVLETRLVGPRFSSRLAHGVWKVGKRAKSAVRGVLTRR